MRLSIVIPTLNEAHYLTETVTQARTQAALGSPPEIIVADCGSTDGTVDLATRLGTRLACGQPPPESRAAACNCGAAAATGDVLLFLDADTLVPDGYDESIQQAFRGPQVVGGAFEFALDGPQLGLRLVECINQVRYHLLPLYYGDQGVFVRADAFRAVRGYPERRLLEAADFCRRLRRVGQLLLIRKPMTTSARRFLEGGIVRVLAHDTRIWLLDFLGLATEKYGAAYREDNRQRGLPGSIPNAR